jgi:phage terminase large subunit-like protein
LRTDGLCWPAPRHGNETGIAGDDERPEQRDVGLVHPNNPILNWNMANAVATMDPAGNRKLDKDKATFRIDGAVALAMLMGLRSRDRAAKPIEIEALIG